jgi:TonB-dependent heme/hemoglobin receptor
MLHHNYVSSISLADSFNRGKKKLRVFAGVVCLTGAALAILLFCPSVQAASLSGRVLDPQGAVLVGVEVRLFSGASSTALEPIRFARTDGEGRFVFQDLPDGSYRLVVSKDGFQPQARTLDSVVEATDLELRLPLAPVHAGVVVSATRLPEDTTGTVLPAAAVTSKVAGRQLSLNVAQSIAEIPNVGWVGAGAFRARPIIRGLDSNRILVLVDGERLNNGRTATSFGGLETSLVDLSQLQQVEVVRGPGSVLYGSDAFGGVVNIVTSRMARSSEQNFGGSFGTNVFSNGNLRRGNVELFGGNRWLSARASGSMGAADNYDSPAGKVFFSGNDENSAAGELQAYPAERQSLYFKFLYRGAYDIGVPSLEASPSFLAVFPFSKLQKFGWGYTANFDKPTLSSLQLRFYKQDQTRDFFSMLTVPGFSQSSETITDVNTFGLDVQASSIAAKRHVLTYGVSYYRDRSRDQRTQILFPGSLNVISSTAPSVPNSTLSATGLFLQHQFEPARRLRLVAGIRYDHFRLSAADTAGFDASAFSTIGQERRDNAWSGNLGASVTLTEGWVLTTNVARAFREPNLFERYFFGRGSVGGFVVPNPDLEPETSVQFDVGTRLTRGPVRLSLNYFHNRLKDLIVTAPGSFQGQTTIGGQPVIVNTNVDRARIQGVEVTAEGFFKALRSQWNPFVSYAWLRGTSLTTSDPLPLITPLSSTAGLRWQLRPWGFYSEARARIVHGGDRVPLGSPPLSGYTTYSVLWGYEVERGEHGLGALLPRGFAGTSFYFGFENITDKLYTNLFDTVPEPGRGFRFGTRFHFDSRSR